MPTTAQLRSRLVAKLKELFQLDQPDLDFGFYRIMHAKAKQVTEFLEKDLLKVIEDTFGHQADQQSTSVLAAARRELEEALGSEALDGEGQPKEAFAQLPAGKRYLDALAKAEAAKDALSAEGEIYDHLYRFFERYYEDGDFISRRYFSRETAGRAAPFAIPYNGEEVKLHWANADQYYIKTGEYFANFTVDLAKAPELEGREGELGLESRDQPLPVHFRIVDAAEGEHGNVKSSESTKRFFILHADDPVGFNHKGELELRFEFRPDPEKPEKSQEGKWQEELRAQAVERLLATLAALPEAAAYHRLLAARVPTEANKDRTLLAKYLHQYTARNTADYFIHKDLGAFLRRELDFYIKNEVMRLDDIENEDAPRVENYLAKLKVLRAIARQLIAFLAQLEDFQKKLWLKKKFVVETNYCITLDRIPNEFYPEIAANDAQREEWVNLYAIDEIKGKSSGDLILAANPIYSSPLTIEFLKSQNHLVLDTRNFSEDFKERLLEALDELDDKFEGLLVNSENFQGIKFVQKGYFKAVDCIYIDPPYNTDSNAILYKNSYKHSSWASLIHSRLHESRLLERDQDSVLCV
jgi:adenine-specific DNA-methyltransferase